MTAQIVTNLEGEFITAEVVKTSVHKEYNTTEWNRIVDRYTSYDDCRFFRDSKSDSNETNYYAIYVADGIRFLKQLSYSSCLSDGGFVYGFFSEGIKDELIVKQLEKFPEYKTLWTATLTILKFTEGRIGNSERAREFMRKETKEVVTRFFTKEF